MIFLAIIKMSRWKLFSAIFAACALSLPATSASGSPDDEPGQPADIAASAYLYRADRTAVQNPPEAWILLMQRANMSFIQPVDVHAPAVQHALCGLLWEEVRRVDHLDLCWPPGAARQPSPEELEVAYFDGVDEAAHTWWNPRTIREAAKPEVSADGCVYSYKIPMDTWGVVVSMRGTNAAAAFAVPELRAYAPDKWKQMEVEIEWGYEEGRAKLDYSGRLETYDGRLSGVAPLEGDTGTKMTGAQNWRSAAARGSRRGLRFQMLYIGSAPWRKTWPYHSPEGDVARTIVTVWTKSGSFSFRAADLENGPILAPEFGFFVRAAEMPKETSGQASTAVGARQYLTELADKHLLTIRQRTRLHTEQTWEGAVTAMMRGTNLPSFPQPPYLPAMRIEVPSEPLTAQWNLGAWHLLRHAVKDAEGKYHFNDFPFGVLAEEDYLILRTLDLLGKHQEAADGLDQWLKLPMQPHSSKGTHELSKPDRPLGLFSDGVGAFTHAVGPDGVGGHMDAVHAMGPGAIMFAMAEHYRLTGDTPWLAANAPRMKANAEWILRQRHLTENIIPNGKQLWNKGLLPAHVVTPDSFVMHMDFYESDAYFWLAVQGMAEMLAHVDPAAGAQMAEESRSYRKDIESSVDRSLTLTPVVPTRDGTYHSFIPFAPYVRGFASGAWGWRRCQGHIGALWNDAQSGDPLISPAGLLSTGDPRVQGHLDVLEDRLLLENDHVAVRTPGFDPGKDWFSSASWQYQCAWERNANIHLQGGDAPNFIRSMLNQYAADILPLEGYQFREHTTAGPHDKVFEDASFLERLRMMLVQEVGDTLWLARATPRAWLENGKRISVQNAPTHFGDVGYEILSNVNKGRIAATVNLPSRHPPREVLLQSRHPDSAPILGVTVNGKKWTNYDAVAGVVNLRGLRGVARVEAAFR